MRTTFCSTCTYGIVWLWCKKPCSLRFCGEFNAYYVCIHHQGQCSHHFKDNTKVSKSIIFRSIGNTLTCLSWNDIAFHTYTTHSCRSRSGGATALIHAGVHPTVVQCMGRWRSDIYKAYCTFSAGLIAGVSQLMANYNVAVPSQATFKKFL